MIQIDVYKRQPYVEKTAFTFEYEVPSVQEFEKRICKTLEKYPYLVAEENGQVLGYAYASTYYARTAYDWTTELSIYVAKEARGQGIGSALYTALEEELQARGYLRFLACIAVPNEASISMHEKRGDVYKRQSQGCASQGTQSIYPSCRSSEK